MAKNSNTLSDDELDDIVYCTFSFYLSRRLRRPFAEAVPLVCRIGRDFGVRRIDNVVGYDCVPAPAQEPRIKRHPTDQTDLPSWCHETRPKEVLFESNRRGARHHMLDYLLGGGYDAKQDPHSRANAPAPMLSLSVRLPDPRPEAGKLNDTVERIVDAAVEALPVVSGNVEIAFAHDTAFGTYDTARLGTDVDYDRFFAWVVWTAPPNDPARRVFRITWKTIVGREFTARLGADREALTREFAELWGRTGDFDHTARPLGDGGLAFSLTNDPYRFVPAQGWLDQTLEGSTSILEPAAWLHWRLRQRDLII